MDKLKKLKEDRAEKAQEYQALVDIADKSELTKEQKAQEETLFAEIAQMDKDIAQAERMDKSKKAEVKREMEALPGAVQDNASEVREFNKAVSNYKIAKVFHDVQKSKQLEIKEGVEKEMHDEAVKEAKDAGISLAGNICIPSKMVQVQGRKAFTVATEGADNVFTSYGGFIPFLKPEPIAGSLGISVRSGLRGNVQWVRQSGDIAFAWEGESDNTAEMTPTVDNISVSPHRVAGYIDVTLQQLAQSVFALEPWLRQILEERYALTVDDAVFAGTGSGDMPTGILNYSGVNVLSLGSSGGDMTYAAVLSMIRDTKTNSARQKNQGFATNAYGEHALRVTPRQTNGVEGNFIMAHNDTALLGRKFATSEILVSTYSEGSQSDLVPMIYSSNWSGAILATWGGLDILFDPYTQRVGGKVRFVANAFMDVEIEQPKEFTYTKDWDATDLPATT